MPLSEDEQRILSEIEQRLYESDPDLAREVSETTVYTHAARGLKGAVAGFVVGTALLLAMLSVSYVLAFVGFVVMLSSALVLERCARRLGRLGLQQVTHRHAGPEGDDAPGGLGQRIRDRFRREGDQGDETGV